jgi:hypothetical protein
MTRLQPHSVGFALGILIGLWHALWAVLVWAGRAQPVIDFIFRLHMITPPYKIAAFDPGVALALVLVTAIIGYLFGWIGAAIWNRYGVGAAPRIDSSSN